MKKYSIHTYEKVFHSHILHFSINSSDRQLFTCMWIHLFTIRNKSTISENLAI